MGQTIRTLAAKPLPEKSVFNRRFVVEICEAVHVHYRNLRILLSLDGFLNLAKGMTNAAERWRKRGEPETGRGTHIELTRLDMDQAPLADNMVRINLNKNLYPAHDGKIFAEGAELADPEYIHVKIRDLRLEMSKEEFAAIADAFSIAHVRLLNPRYDEQVQKS